MELNQPSSSLQKPDTNLSTELPPTPTSAISNRSSVISPQHDIYRSIQSYPFHSDPSYQSGLATILGHPTTPATQSELSDNPDLILQAQCFYFTRKYGIEPIDITEYKNFLAITEPLQSYPQSQTPRNDDSTPPLERPDPVPRPSAPTPNTALTAPTISAEPLSQDQDTINPPPQTTTETSDPTPPYPTSFADIVDLITQNKPIPGIEQIPETVLDPGSSKQDHTARRKKPWEKTVTSTNDTPAASTDTTANTISTNDDKAIPNIETVKKGGEGIVRILQPGAIADSGLLAKE